MNRDKRKSAVELLRKVATHLRDYKQDLGTPRVVVDLAKLRKVK